MRAGLRPSASTVLVRAASMPIFSACLAASCSTDSPIHHGAYTAYSCGTCTSRRSRHSRFARTAPYEIARSPSSVPSTPTTAGPRWWSRCRLVVVLHDGPRDGDGAVCVHHGATQRAKVAQDAMVLPAARVGRATVTGHLARAPTEPSSRDATFPSRECRERAGASSLDVQADLPKAPNGARTMTERYGG
jgi:hypothetical protein